MSLDIQNNIEEDVLTQWQSIANLLAEIVGIPAALIMRLNGPNIEVLVSSESDGNPYKPGDAEHFEDSGLYCETVVKTQGTLLVPDALADPHWQNNPDVELNMISYLGYPISYPDNTPFGTLCILDSKCNPYSDTIKKLMIKFQEALQNHLQLVYMNQCLGDENKKLNDYVKEIQALRQLVPICSYCKNIQDENKGWHSVDHYLQDKISVSFSQKTCPDCAI
ncbi:MAG: GAF domain-containing protein [Candidatus Cloacimonetes bacterium]|nr:GAF domain-containing protein [Candidatus Cloacimonadota bacterium]